MNISIIEELQEFEKEEETALERKKREFLKVLEQQKQDILDKNDMDLYEIKLGRHKIIKKAQEKARKDALVAIQSLKEKTGILEEIASQRIEEAMNLVFKDFLNQNV